MSLWLSFVLVASAAIAITEGRAVPDKPVSVMMDSYGNPIVYLRDKRAPVGYPHRTMMFTGYYRPVRRTNDGQTAGVYAQGNAVSGGSYVGDSEPDYLQRGPEPIDESGISSSEAEAAPNPLEHHVDEEQQEKYTPQKEQQGHRDSYPIQEQDQEPSDSTTEAPSAEEPLVEPTKAPRRPSKRVGSKKTKKRPVVVASEESDESEDEDEDDEENDDDDRTAVPFVPFKSNRRRNNIPNLNNFFPMVFSFPRGVSRGGSSDTDSIPEMITAVANSYSTSKGGVASSIATAYGGLPQG